MLTLPLDIIVPILRMTHILLRDHHRDVQCLHQRGTTVSETSHLVDGQPLWHNI